MKRVLVLGLVVLWVISSAVAACSQTPEWIVYDTANSGLAHDRVHYLLFDEQGNKWIGTRGGGLVKFDGVNWTVYNTDNSGLPHDRVSSLAFDGKGNKWIGTWGGGLAVYREGGVILTSVQE